MFLNNLLQCFFSTIFKFRILMELVLLGLFVFWFFFFLLFAISQFHSDLKIMAMSLLVHRGFVVLNISLRQ